MTIQKIIESLIVPRQVKEYRKKVSELALKIKNLPFGEAMILFEAMTEATKTIKKQNS